MYMCVEYNNNNNNNNNNNTQDFKKTGAIK